MARVKKRYRKSKVYKSAFISLVLLIFVISLSYFILTKDIVKPRINELTASYISFNNSNTTDMLKISSLEVMNNTKGISYKNKSMREFIVNGKKNKEYKIVLYHLGNMIEDEYVRFALFENGVLLKEDTISNMLETNDDGRVIYESKVSENNNYVVKMWIDKSYTKEPNNISYEIKIKTS